VLQSRQGVPLHERKTRFIIVRRDHISSAELWARQRVGLAGGRAVAGTLYIFGGGRGGMLHIDMFAHNTSGIA
jgi:hypothetical protein